MFAVSLSRRKALSRIGTVAALGWLAACGPMPISTGGPALGSGEAVPVALLVPGASGAAGDAVLAQNLENAARLAIADLQGVQIDLRVYNTGADPASAAQAASQAVDEGAKIILGPVFAEAANAVGGAVAPSGVNVLSFSNNTDIAGGNVFVLGNTFANTAGRLSAYAASQGRRNIAIVHDNTAAGDLGNRAIANALARSSASSAGSIAYEFSQNGVVQAVPTIVSTVRSGGADAVFFTADTAGALPLLTQLVTEAGIRPPAVQFIGLTRWDIPPATLALPGVQGGWFAMPDPGLTNQFEARYQAAYGQPPHPIAGLAYDGIAAIGALARRGGADALGRAALTQGSGFVGVNGIFRLRPDGTNERGLAVATIRNNQVVVIDPAPRSFGGAGL